MGVLYGEGQRQGVGGEGRLRCLLFPSLRTRRGAVADASADHAECVSASVLPLACLRSRFRWRGSADRVTVGPSTGSRVGGRSGCF